MSLMTVLLLASCSSDDYLNCIPGESITLLSVDLQQLSEENTSVKQAELLKSVLGVGELSDCGIDLSEKIYLFENNDGNFGLCAKVKDDGDLNDFINKNLAKKGKSRQTSERKGCWFTVLDNSWLMGFSDKAMLIMGPVLGADVAQLQQQMLKYLKADEETSIKSSKLFERMQTLNSSIAFVGQAQAFPESIALPFTLGAPKDADASQIMIAAEIANENGCVTINGETFSFNETIDKALKAAVSHYRPITGKYVSSVSQDIFAGLFLNINGIQLMDMLQSDKSTQALLAGINTAIDMDNIIRSIDGDVFVGISDFKNDKPSLKIGAQLANANWLDDVDYWKKSCPGSVRIVDEGKNAFRVINGNQQEDANTFHFGVSDDMCFWAESVKSAPQLEKQSDSPFAAKIQNKIKGKKLCVLFNYGQLRKQLSPATFKLLNDWLKPLFGNIKTIIYTQK